MVIQEIGKLREKKHKHMIFVRIPSLLVPIDKETIADMKYYSQQYISIIGFSYADKVLSSDFH